MKTLVKYLESLNTAENQVSLYVNPDNIDEYCCGRHDFGRDGVPDGWVCVGSLDNLSFGCQSTRDAIEQFLEESGGEIEYNGKRVKINADAILEAYDRGCLHEDFQYFLAEEAEIIKDLWREIDAEHFVIDTLPEIFANAKLATEVEQEMYA